MNITKHIAENFTPEMYEYITKSFIIKLANLMNQKDYFNKNRLSFGITTATAQFSFDNLAEFDDNTSPNDRFESVSISYFSHFDDKTRLFDMFTIGFSPHHVFYHINTDELTDIQVESIMADIREDYYYLLDCAMSGKQYDQRKEYGYSVSKKADDNRKSKSSVWYKSSLFWTIAGVVVALIVGAVTIFLQIIK